MKNHVNSVFFPKLFLLSFHVFKKIYFCVNMYYIYNVESLPVLLVISSLSDLRVGLHCIRMLVCTGHSDEKIMALLVTFIKLTVVSNSLETRLVFLDRTNFFDCYFGFILNDQKLKNSYTVTVTLSATAP